MTSKFDNASQTELVKCNRDAWNASASEHRNSERWEILTKGFSSPGFSTFDSTITQLLTKLPIAGKRVVQVGCNNGQELLSTLSLGATSGIGIDQSKEFLQQAKELNELAQANCQFLEANIYELPSTCQNDFDVGLITIGVLNWMPDIDGFFNAVAGLLKPSGQLVIYETHPFLEMFDPDAKDPFSPAISYFSDEPYVSEEAIIYDDATPGAAPKSYWFAHTVGDILNACIKAGLRICEFNEYPHSNRETLYDRYVGREAQLPMCFSLIAEKSS